MTTSAPMSEQPSWHLLIIVVSAHILVPRLVSLESERLAGRFVCRWMGGGGREGVSMRIMTFRLIVIQRCLFRLRGGVFQGTL
ncbi:hypothetical protein F5Y14DRAFT_399240, partial [Nemania sp. NC0429]